MDSDALEYLEEIERTTGIHFLPMCLKQISERRLKLSCNVTATTNKNA